MSNSIHEPTRCFPRAVALWTTLFLLMLLPGVAAQEPLGTTETFELEGFKIAVDVPYEWSVAPTQFVNSYTLVDVPSHLQGIEPVHARFKLLVEPRTDRSEALEQLRQLGEIHRVTPEDFLEINGHVTMQSTRLEQRPQPDRGPQFADPQVLRIETAMLIDGAILHLQAALPSDADAALIRQVHAMMASVDVNVKAEATQVREEIEALRRQVSTDLGLELLQQPRSQKIHPLLEEVQTPPGTNNQRIYASGFGEIEIGVSPDGQNIVVGRQGQWVTSNDGGLMFTAPQSVGIFDGGDPSVAWGQSGSFYYAGIDRNCQNTGYQNPPAGGAFGVDCTGIVRSDDNGQSFPIGNANPAVVCPRDDPNNPGTVANRCFPDQEHIAADRVNAGGGGDQVYSTWRNFDAMDQDGGLVCTQDSGVNWSAPLDLGGGSFFPRITVGQDGFVYVLAIFNNGTHRVFKFSSCANGLTMQPGFPVNIGGRTPVDCPFAGHDRCDQNPTSQTIAVDDTNPNHVYMAWANADGTPNRDATILVRDSIDGGLTWRPAVRVNANVAGPRIMPWLCTTGGDAFVTWFDRRSATPCPNGNCPNQARNDRTDFYGGSAGLDFGGNLVAKGEFLISEAPDEWCDVWPNPTRQAFNPAPGASEACSTQPQLAGQCCVDADNDQSCDDANGDGIPDGSLARCDISPNLCGGGNPGDPGNPGEVCLGGGGRPKYGDYNGSACAAGRLMAGWPSRLSPPGVASANAGQIGILFDVFLVGNVPLATVPSELSFTTCVDDEATTTLEVCNTGNENLLVDAITSDSPDFVVTVPSSGFPVQISPDFCFPFEVTYTPTAIGPDSAVLTVATNDPANLEIEVDVLAQVGEPDLQAVIANSGEFGNVCRGEQSDLVLALLNQGTCNLTISDISLVADDGSFELPADLTLPLVLSPDADFNLPIRFSPDACFDTPEARGIRIISDSPGESPLILDVSGAAPCPQLVIDPVELSGLFAFPATVVDADGTLGCASERSAVLRNQGVCPLTIDSIVATAADFAVIQPSLFPVLLPGGEETLEVVVRFTPQADADPLAPSEVTGQLTVISDDPDGAVMASLCGESVAQSGVRLLVTDQSPADPVPYELVDDLRLTSKGIHTPGPINLRFTDQALTETAICGNPVSYHVDQETLPSTETSGSNPNSSYTAKAKVGNLQTSRSFTLGQCDFLEMQLQLEDSNSPVCLLLPQGAACGTDGECCSGKCTGQPGNKTCK